MWLRKQNLKSLIRFHSADKSYNYNRWWKQKETKTQESAEQMKT